jgi:serine/threonine kinase 32
MDNVLLDLNGHAHITDFNCATVFRPGEWRHNHHGTRRYMGKPFHIVSIPPTKNGKAPEMVQKLGYDWRADFWNLGNLVYELFFYRHPFGYKMKTTAEIDKSIVEDELQFPPNAEELCSPECIDFIKGVSRSFRLYRASDLFSIAPTEGYVETSGM